MLKVNLSIVFNQEKTHVLMCQRQKAPYKGKYNFVGGKLEDGEDFLNAAYRELLEETNISHKDIELIPLFTTTYHQDQISLQVYYGYLMNDVTLIEEAHPLVWMCLDEDFTNDQFAGEGNIPHMLAMISEGQEIIQMK